MAMLDFDTLEEKFGIRLLEASEAVYTVNAADLLNETHMRDFIAAYGPMMKALDDTAAAAYFSSWLSGIALAQQYMVSIYNTALDLSLANISVCLIPASGYTRIAFHLHQWRENEGPSASLARGFWREAVLTEFYGETMRPLMERLSAVSGLHIGQLWGQLPTKFNYYMAAFQKITRRESQRKRLADDYEYLKQELDPAVFGRSKNPFDVKPRMIEHLLDASQQVRMKNSCCRYIHTENGDYCYTCPRLKEEERAVLRRDYRAKASAAASASS
ncbi:(2Fe-2S)-binding protein [Paenibacillaceae bacterium]|nr:(2Fe-2S)-binding protein [Paenibacillaceae bacterium]